MTDLLALNTPANFTPTVVGTVSPAITVSDIIRMTTVTPAAVLGNRIPKLGTLQINAPADISIMHIAQAPVGSPFPIFDALGHSGTTTQMFVSDSVYIGGLQQ